MKTKKVGDLTIGELQQIIDDRLEEKLKTTRPVWIDEMIEEKLKTTRPVWIDEMIEEKLKTTRPVWIDEMIEEKLANSRPTWVDEIMGELKTNREEQIILGGRQSEHSDQLEDHEERIKKVEVQVISH